MTEWLFAATFQQLWFLLEALVKGFTSAAVTILLLRVFFFIEGFYYINLSVTLHVCKVKMYEQANKGQVIQAYAGQPGNHWSWGKKKND